MVDARYLGKSERAFFSGEGALEIIAEQLVAWRNPINRDSPALRDGRSAPPPPPDCIRDELLCAAVNKFLGTNYRVTELLELPDAWLNKMLLLINTVNTYVEHA